MSQLSDPFDGMFLELAELARAHRLTLYVGAGVSAGAPSEVPGGQGLAEAMREPLERHGVAVIAGDGSPRSLEAVADDAEARGVLNAMKEIAAALPVFRRRPNVGHEVLAILVREGLVRLLSANWDPYVEDGAVKHGFHLDPVVTDTDRLHRFGQAPFHKLHGCVTQPMTLLVATSELAAIPAWADAEAAGALAGSVVVFVGIGTVADYVGTRVRHVLDIAGPHLSVWVASRSISNDWEEVLNADAKRVETDASPFLEDLLRAVIQRRLDDVSSQAREMDRIGGLNIYEPGLARIREVLGEHDARWVWRWVADGVMGVEPGTAVLGSPEAMNALLAAGRITDNQRLRASGGGQSLSLELPNCYLEVVACRDQHAVAVQKSEEDRIAERRMAGVYRDRTKPVVAISAGHRGEFVRREAVDSLVGYEPADHLVGGPDNADVFWVPAEAFMQGLEVPLP